MSEAIATTATITQVDRYVDVNKHVPQKYWDTPNGMSQKMYCFHFDTPAGHARSFVKRANQGGLSAWFRDNGFADDKSATVEIGETVTIRGQIKKRVPADDRGPERMVLTHVKIEVNRS